MSYTQSPQEENLNVITHGIGLMLSATGLILLLLNYNPDVINTGYVFIYGLSLVLLFTASSLYHYASTPKYKTILRKFDHISIYVLIAGTYTPICVSVLKDSKGYLILGLVWGITLFGLVLKVFFTGKFEKISLLLYLIMGWLVVIDITTLYQVINETELLYLILGGAFYTGGVLFYVMHRLKYHHVIWHVFVLLGALFHYLMVWSITTG